MQISTSLKSALLVSGALLVTSPLRAEDGGQQAAQGADQHQGVAAGDIVVTANKRSQNLSKVGMSVSAVSGDDLTKQRIGTVADLAPITPGLTFAPSPTAVPIYTLRGVGFYETSLAAYPDVALYVDQVPLALPVLSSLTAFDLERVEVLKGPQGTLFGNNATGGAINFVVAKPASSFHAGFETSYGRFNTFEAQAFMTGPITNTLTARIALKAVRGDGWQRSYTRDDTNGALNNVAGRLLLDWRPSDRFKVLLNLSAWHDQNDTVAPQHIGVRPQFDIPNPPFGIATYPFAPNNARAADWSPGLPFANTKFKQAALNASYDFGSVTLTSLTGLSQTNFLNGTEADGTALYAGDIVRDSGLIKSFTQELRLANDSASRVRWVVGANYERTTVDEFILDRLKESTTAPLFNFSKLVYSSDQKMRNIAGFGNVEFDVTDHVTLKAGARRTEAKRSTSAFIGDSAAYPLTEEDRLANGVFPNTLTTTFGGLYASIYGDLVPPLKPNESIILDNRVNSDGTPVNPATYLTTGNFIDTFVEKSTSWSVGVDFKPSDTLLFYANVSRGFKSGSYPTLAGSIAAVYEAVKQEELTDYEIGFKAQALNKRVSLSGALFYYDYRDKQLVGAFVDPIFGQLTRLINVPKSTIKGAELNIDARPVDGLTLSASISYLDAKVKEYNGIVGAAIDPDTGLFVTVTDSFKGVRLPFSPKIQYNLRMDYEFAISGALDGLLGVGVSGQSRSIGILTKSQADEAELGINPRAIVNANIGIQNSAQGWTLSLYGKNIFNKYYWTNAFQSFDNLVRYSARPVEYGVSLKFKM